MIAKILMEENVLRKKYCIDISAREEQPVWEVIIYFKTVLILSSVTSILVSRSMLQYTKCIVLLRNLSHLP